MLDYIEVDDAFTMAKMTPPRETHGFTLAELKLRDNYGVKVIGIKSPGQDFEYATDDSQIGKDDILLVAGEGELLDRFAHRP